MLNNFINTLPQKPYSTDDLFWGIKPRKKEKALKLRYIQPNGPTHLYWMAFDVDRSGSAIDWEDLSCPAPNITMTNPENKHSHLLYALETSVRTAPDGSIKALKYAAAVQAGLTNKLKADNSYSGLIIKNPTHEHWMTNVIHNDFYDLNELADWVDLPSIDLRKKAANEAFGLGRNCIAFDNLRKWAYNAIRRAGWPSYNVWLDMCLEHVEKTNGAFENPLGYGEIKQIAISVAKWTHRHITEQGFSEVQRARIRKRWGYDTEARNKPWEALGISRATYYRQKKTGLILPD